MLRTNSLKNTLESHTFARVQRLFILTSVTGNAGLWFWTLFLCYKPETVVSGFSETFWRNGKTVLPWKKTEPLHVKKAFKDVREKYIDTIIPQSKCILLQGKQRNCLDEQERIVKPQMW